MPENIPSISDDLMNFSPPANVKIGDNTIIQSEKRCWLRFYSQLNPALTIGNDCTIYGVHFALGKEAKMKIGNYCYIHHSIFLCEEELYLGNFVVIAPGVTIADSDFHPIAPAARIADAVALSPLGNKQARPQIIKKPVIIEDDVWIGPNATILKGVRIGTGAFIEAGSLVTRDIPPRARVLGNPARVVGKV